LNVKKAMLIWTGHQRCATFASRKILVPLRLPAE
tara:strand:- start:1545 stop:1646 length:102 start_codon:yes stop_codon:yes gene_type:complete